jgi:GT2 family glycosyltransferase/glycosyltransferase involved in cell wall biosynthesis
MAKKFLSLTTTFPPPGGKGIEPEVNAVDAPVFPANLSLALQRRIEKVEQNRAKEFSILEKKRERLEVEVEELRRYATEGIDLTMSKLEENLVLSLASLHRPRRRKKWLSFLGTLRHFSPRQIFRLVKEYRLLASSALFDPDRYLARYPDVRKAGIDPLLHYLLFGAAERRSAGPIFDGALYLDANPDVKRSGMNPLVHYLRYGVFERRSLGFARSSSFSLPDNAIPEPQTDSSLHTQLQLPRCEKPLFGVDVTVNEPFLADLSTPVDSEPQLWHFIGDSIEWLKVHKQLSGVGRVSTEILLASLDAAASHLAVPCVFRENSSELIALPPSQENEPFFRKLGAPLQRQAVSRMSRSLAGRNSPKPGDHIFFTGLVWTPTFADLFRHLHQEGIKFSVLVFDIIPIESPEFADEHVRKSFSDWLTTTVSTASSIFVSGRFVKDQILRWALLSGAEMKAEIVVVPFGLRDIEGAVSSAELSRDPSTDKVDLSRFVLSVGTIDSRKNQVLLCRIWSKLAETIGFGDLPQLVLVGRNDLKIQSYPDFAELIARDKIIVLEGLPDQQLSGLYDTCLFTAFPSLSEGYGLPVAESLQHGKLCLSSNLAVITEHAGDLVWYFDANDLAGAVDVFTCAIRKPQERLAAETRIKQEFRPPRWTETYEIMLAAASRALSVPPSHIEADEPRVQYPGAKEVDIAGALSRAARWCRSGDPDVSILIINWNDAAMTLECIRQIWMHTYGCAYEIVIADNGSPESDVQRLHNLGNGIRLLELRCNRFFGEANNIAAEAACGRYICTLNNDAFVQPGWLMTLYRAMEENPDLGAAGPTFLFPDGVLQEAGADVDADGYPLRFGRGEKQLPAENLTPRFVDYISAAALLLRRDLFMEAGGFDLAYEPAYYEDVDLCFKIQALGRKILYCPEARVVHLEGHSMNHDAISQRRRKALGDINRDKFVSRWGKYLRSRDQQILSSLGVSVLPSPRVPVESKDDLKSVPTAVLHTPYALTPGGGESYLLTLGSILAASYRVSIVTAQPYSDLRLQNLGRELQLDLSALKLITEEEFLQIDAPDLMIAMDNHILPSIEGRGETNTFLCQFPFPMEDGCLDAQKSLIEKYEKIIVYSEYVRAHVYAGQSAYHLSPTPIEVVYPPVQQIGGDASNKKDTILSVGRFFVGGHSKRHDALIETFKLIAFQFERPVELHLAGSSTPDSQHMDYLSQLMEAARGFPIFFHINPSAEQLHLLFQDAALYWHGTGIGADLVSAPEKAEHFGISLVEAMSAQAVPFAFTAGGPREIIKHGETGFLYETQEQLALLTLDLFAPTARERRVAMGRAAGRRAVEFSREYFARRIGILVGELAERAV